MQKIFTRLFSIRPHEFRLVQLFFFYFTCIGMFIITGIAIGDSLFLANVAPEKVSSLYAWMHVGIAGATVIITWGYSKIIGLVSRITLLVGMQFLFLLSLLVFRQVIPTDGVQASSWVYLGLVIWLKVCGQLLVMLFFSFAGDYFTVQDAKRLYVYINGGLLVGIILASTIIRSFVSFIGAENMLYVCIGFLSAGAGFSLCVYRWGTPIVHTEKSTDKTTKTHLPLGQILSHSYVQLVFLVMLLGLLCFVIADFQLKISAQNTFPNSVDLAAFFGDFYLNAGIVTLLFQFLAVGFLFRQVGIINCLLFLPGIHMVMSVLFFSTGYGFFTGHTLLIIAVANFFRIVLSNSLTLSSREILFLPLRPHIRLRAQAMMDGMIIPVGQGIGGLLIAVLTTTGLQLFQFSPCLFFFAFLWIVILFLLRHRYRNMLTSSLKNNQLDAIELRDAVQFSNVDFMLEELLSSEKTQVISFALDLLQERPLGRLALHIRKLACDSAPILATKAIALLGRDGNTEHLKILEQALRSSSDSVREAAVLAICQIQHETALDRIHQWLNLSDPVIRDAALIGGGRYGGQAGQALILPILHQMIASTIPEDRKRAARVLRDIRDPAYTDFIISLLADEDPAVQSFDETLRETLFQVLASISGKTAQQTLWRFFSGNYPVITRMAAGYALQQFVLNGQWHKIEDAEFSSMLETLFDNIRLLNHACRNPGETGTLLWELLHDHAQLEIECLFYLLAYEYDAHQIRQIRDNFFGPDLVRHANALELLDDLLPRRLAPDIIRLLDGFVQQRTGEHSGLSSEVVDRLSQQEPWLKVLMAYYVSGETGDPPALAVYEQELYRLLPSMGFLKKVHLFTDVPGNYLVSLAHIAQLIEVKSGTTIFFQEDKGDAMYLICRGTIRVLVNGREINLMGVGECLGEMSLLDGAPRSASCVAAEDTELLKITGKDFERLVMNQANVALALLRTLAVRLRQQTLASLQYRNPEKRESHEAQGYRPAISTYEEEESVAQPASLFSEHQRDIYQLIEYIAFLKRVPLFQGLPDEYLIPLTELTHMVLLPKGEVLFHQGEQGDAMFLVRSGTISVQVNAIEVNQMEVGDCIGEMSLLDNAPRSATCIAKEDAELLKIEGSDFETVVRSQPSVVWAMLQTLAARLRYQTTKSTEFS